MTGHFTIIDWVVLAAYFIGTMSIGFYFYRKTRSTEGFTAGGRSLPGWACGLSILATYLSSISFLALPGGAYADNWNPFVFSLSLPITTIIALLVFMPYYRRTGEVSAYALLERRFGPWARVYGSFFYLLTQLARIGTVMYLMALPLSVLMGWSMNTIILITGISVTVYAFVGGIVAVIWADALQAIVLMAGAIVCALVILFSMPAGPSQLFEVGTEYNKFSLGSFSSDLTQNTFWVVLIYGIVINLQNFGIDQSFVQRYIASSSKKEAVKSVWIGGLVYVPISAVFFFIGTGLFVYYQTQPELMEGLYESVAVQRLAGQGITVDSPDFQQHLMETTQQLDEEGIGDEVFPHFLGSALPTGITGLLIAAIFAAAMSTISTSLNSSATLIMNDWYKRYIKPEASEKSCMMVLYMATIAWGVLGTVVALLLIGTTGALDAWWTLSGIFGGGILGLFLLGLVSKRANSPVAAVSVILGLIIICWMSLSPMLEGTSWAWLASPFHRYLIPVFGTAVIMVAGFMLSRFRQIQKVVTVSDMVKTERAEAK